MSSSQLAETPICPSFLPFRTVLPTHYVDTSPVPVSSLIDDNGADETNNSRSSRGGTPQFDSDGKRYRFPLPPSFADVSPAIPGYRCEIVYEISVYVTRGRARAASTNASGNKDPQKGKGLGAGLSIGTSFAKGMSIGKGLSSLLGKRAFV